KALGEYHGEMVGATLLPVGLPLAGLQVYENMRAVDYLRSRPEVDGDRIGITGASGGGNQTMYTGAFDERFKAAIPVCSVGNYQSYLSIGCCQCEVIPGALRYTEEWGVLGLMAPRALMVVNATLDAVQFSVAEAKKSLALTAPVFQLYGHPDHLRHAIFESKHDYNQQMREAMYGWMTLHLKGEGDGSPIAEQPITTEDPESLRCYPGQTRPDDWMTIPRFAAAEGKKLLSARKPPSDAAAWRESSEKTRKALVEHTLGGFPKNSALSYSLLEVRDSGVKLIQFESEPALAMTAQMQAGKEKASLVILLDFEGADKARQSELAKAILASGSSLVTFDLRATGALAQPGDTIGRAPDHNTAEWGLWIGRPLLGQWAHDVRQLLDAFGAIDDPGRRNVTLIGVGPAGLVALTVGAVDERVTRIAALGTLASYITEVPYENQRLGVMAPGILKEVGDVAHLASLCAPKRVVIAGGRTGGGKILKLDALREAYLPATQVWDMVGAGGELQLLGTVRPDSVLQALK
ncbi:alpha/beta hydrolase family protein, partial [Singulisphaera rosea]